jgi:hypothetical protein
MAKTARFFCHKNISCYSADPAADQISPFYAPIPPLAPKSPASRGCDLPFSGRLPAAKPGHQGKSPFISGEARPGGLATTFSALWWDAGAIRLVLSGPA